MPATRQHDYLKTGRSAQKRETRSAILDAAADLLESGDAGAQPAMSDIAAAAGVSRPTAYRYFPSVEALLLEAALDRRTADAGSVIGSETNPARRVQRVQTYLWDLASGNEAEFRVYLKATMQEWLRRRDLGTEGAQPPLRGGRRLEMLRAALEPSSASGEMERATRDRLVHALAALSGIEFLVAMRDVCGLGDDEAREVMRWAADALMKAALKS